MVLCKNSIFQKKKMKPNWARYHKNSRRWSDRDKTFSYIFHPQIEAGTLWFARIYKAGAQKG